MNPPVSPRALAARLRRHLWFVQTRILSQAAFRLTPYWVNLVYRPSWPRRGIGRRKS